MTKLDPQVPEGALAGAWDRSCASPTPAAAERGQFRILVVGTGLAGATAAATLAGLGYRVRAFCLEDSPRRAATATVPEGLSPVGMETATAAVAERFAAILAGGDYRARPANVCRLAQLAPGLLARAAALGVPPAGGGQTGQHLLAAACRALGEQAQAGRLELFPYHELLDLVVVEGRVCGIVTRNLLSGELRSYTGQAVVLATGGYANVYFASACPPGSNATALLRAWKRGAFFANPSLIQAHPYCLEPAHPGAAARPFVPASLALPERVWVPRQPGDPRLPEAIPAADRRYCFSGPTLPAGAQGVPAPLACRTLWQLGARGEGVGASGRAVYLDLPQDVAAGDGPGHPAAVAAAFGQRLGLKLEPGAALPVSPAPYRSLGGLWVDYRLMSNLPGLFVAGAANGTSHGANLLGANGLLQSLADGMEILPQTVGAWLAAASPRLLEPEHPACRQAEAAVQERLARLLALPGHRTPREFHEALGKLLWEHCGPCRNEAGLRRCLGLLPQLREEFWQDARVGGRGDELNQALERAGRVADFLELAELMVQDALWRRESCGQHYREDLGAGRDDARFGCIAAWECTGDGAAPQLHREELPPGPGGTER